MGKTLGAVFMSHISRRHLAVIGFVLPFAFLTGAVTAQENAKPEVKWSEAKPIIKAYVEQMSAVAKKRTGVEFTVEQKNQLVETIVAKMDAQHIYDFVDP
jgi:hypothetical protein